MTNTMVVPRQPPHMIYRGDESMKLKKDIDPVYAALIERAKKENWWWKPYEDMPTDHELPTTSVLNAIGERIPSWRLTQEQQEQIRQRVAQVLSDAIRQQINIISIRNRGDVNC